MSTEHEPCGCDESLRLRAEVEQLRQAMAAKDLEIKLLREAFRRPTTTGQDW